MKHSRVRLGILMAAFMLTGVVIGGWFWTGLAFAVMGLAFLELRALFKHKEITLSSLMFFPATLCMVLVTHVHKVMWLWPILLLAIMLGTFLWLFHRPRLTLADLNATTFSLLYLGVLPLHAILLRQEGLNAGLPLLQQDGVHYLLLVLLVVIASDVGAYYVGRRFGRRLLNIELSPKKTREGAFGGLFFGILVGMPLAAWIGFPWHDGFILSALIVVAGALGDLVESKIKREIGVKDSSALLAGHGGILDRLDSYLFSIPMAYYYIHWVVHHDGLWLEIVEFSHRLFSV